ncbi:MAG: Gfo/Idh/MocA family oxidoreductase, partial [Pseudomonadota bacterium]
MSEQRTRPVRYAVVGAGWISQEAFLPAIPQVENSVVTVIVSGNAENAGKLAKFYGIDHVIPYEDYDAMLALDLFDAVYVALPNSMHADYAIRAMKAGKHALVEKPLAVSVSECEAMIAAAEENNVLLMTAYRLHSEPGTVKVLDLIRAEEIGDPRHFACTFSFQSGDDNHRLLAKHWGGPLQDIGVYCLNAARHCFQSEPTLAVAVKGHGDGDARFEEVEGSMAVTLAFPGERLAQFLFSFEADDTDTYRVIGTKGEITVEQCFDF